MPLTVRHRLNPESVPLVEMCSFVEAYLEGHISRHDLDRAFGRLVRTIARTDRQQDRLFYGRVRNLLAERGYGHRTEESVRKVLRRLLDEQDATPYSDTVEAKETSGMSDQIETIVMDHSAPVVGSVPVLHTEKPDQPKQPNPEPQQQEVQVTTTVKPAEPAEKPAEQKD